MEMGVGRYSEMRGEELQASVNRNSYQVTHSNMVEAALGLCADLNLFSVVLT